MQKQILWAAVIVVILGGGYLIWQNYSAPATGTADENTEIPGGPGSDTVTGEDENLGSEDNFAASIAYTNDGYSPSTVTIKKGQTVRFINASDDQNTWPASAVHPTHSVYPGKSSSNCLGSDFDACRGLIPGEMWDFTFNEVGEWRFHDHLHASKTGTVIVTE